MYSYHFEIAGEPAKHVQAEGKSSDLQPEKLFPNAKWVRMLAPWMPGDVAVFYAPSTAPTTREGDKVMNAGNKMGAVGVFLVADKDYEPPVHVPVNKTVR